MPILAEVRQPGWDHPREYGENLALSADKAPDYGPSPRIRGEYPSQSGAVPVTGTIPANTGRINWVAETQRFMTDHPREYGENARALPGVY